MSDNLFTQEGQTPEPQAQPAPQGGEPKAAETVPATDSYANQLASIVTEDGRQKYADVNTALNSIPHAQSHIAELTRKNAELEAEVQKRAGMEQVLERIDSKNQTNSETPSDNSLSEAHVMELLNSALTQREEQSTALANEIALTNGLVEKFGTKEKAMEMLANKAKELNVNVDFMQSLAQKSPKAVLSYFGEAAASAPSPVAPGNNTTTLQSQTQDVNKLEEAKAKLFGQRDPLVESWRAAAPTNN